MWLEPYPDALLAGTIDAPLGPEARYEQIEAISLAVVTPLQLLPARQRAVLILRDVLGYHAIEVADMLDSTVESVAGALKRARANLPRRLPPTADREASPAPSSPAEQALVARFVRAYESSRSAGPRPLGRPRPGDHPLRERPVPLLRAPAFAPRRSPWPDPG